MVRQNPFVPLEPRPLPPFGNEPLRVNLVRGNAVESRHYVHVLACDSRGLEAARWGNPDLTFFPRSSIKLIQAVAWVAPGYGIASGYGAEELSIACGSHEGEPAHVAVIERWLARLGLTERDLECGAHEPYDGPSAVELLRAGKLPTQLHNNCSGKHCGLLTACAAEGWGVAGYSNFDHPVQARLREVQSGFFGLDLAGCAWGIDGCGIPTYSISLKALALGMARVADPSAFSEEVRRAVVALSEAIALKPLLIGGSDSYSSKVVAETGGRVFAKVGAEGVYGVWIPEKGLGIALKCEDGNARATEAALAMILADLGYPLPFFSPLTRRWTGEIVGQFVCG